MSKKNKPPKVRGGPTPISAVNCKKPAAGTPGPFSPGDKKISPAHQIRGKKLGGGLRSKPRRHIRGGNKSRVPNVPIGVFPGNFMPKVPGPASFPMRAFRPQKINLCSKGSFDFRVVLTILGNFGFPAHRDGWAKGGGVFFNRASIAVPAIGFFGVFGGGGKRVDWRWGQKGG